MTKLLSKNDVMKILTIRDTIDILEKAFIDLAEGKANMPQRTPITAPGYNGLALFMPAYLEGMGALGTKVVTVYKDNPVKFDLPNVMGTILILDEKTGAPKAIMDGGFITAMRTGAVAGLASKYLARKKSEVHTLFGIGGMAKTHVLAVDAVRDIKKLNLVSLDTVEKKENFKAELQKEITSEIEIVEKPLSALKESDIITLITTAKEPIIDFKWIQPGAHINGIGAHAPAMREIDTATVANSKIVCDFVDACKAEAGDLIIPVEEGKWNWGKVHGSLGDVITNKITSRENDLEITLFKSVGLAIQDISTAHHVYQKAVELGTGIEFSF
ncbi:MAG: ornithine cyclodeaminase family protein [Ignavibacteria bacterium]|jgi:ornithine cyclodeaminase/alanine dehydrogenase-like protein (mu-crystallin family)